MKNICFFSGDISRSGGTERVTTIIANELQKNEYSLSILSLRQSEKNLFFMLDSGIQTYSLFESKKLNHLQLIFKLRNYLNKNNIDILIDVDTILDLYGIPATIFSETKLISWEHFNFYENLGVPFRDLARKLSSKFSDAIVTLTKEDKDYFVQNLSPKCPVKAIYNPININKSSAKYKCENKTLLSAGRLTHQKGFDYLVDVAKLVFEKHPDWKWIVLGEGEERKSLENKIIQYNLADHILFMGNVDNIEKYYENTSIFVLTSRYEGFGLVLTEAKSFGLPCVSFKCKAGPSEIILDDKNGYLIECFDIGEMADRIILLIESQELREEFSKNSLCDTDKFHVDKIMLEWKGLIDSLTKGDSI